MSRALHAAWIHVNEADSWWARAHERGRAAVEEAFAERITTSSLHSVGDGDAWLAAAQSLVDDGADIVYVCDVSVQSLVELLAERNSQVKFEHCQGSAVQRNLSTFRAARDEHAYVSGILAGAATTSGVLGAVEGIRSPHDLMFTNAWVLGVQRSNPAATVLVDWVGSYHDADQAAREARAVGRLVDSGADVIGGNLAENAAVVLSATNRGCFVSAHDEQLSSHERVLDAAYLDWRPFYLRSVASLIDGSWRPDARYLRSADGVVRNSTPAASVPDWARNDAADVAGQLSEGAFEIWRGPLRDADAHVVVSEGQVLGGERGLAAENMTPTERYLNSAALNWLVEGIVEL